jgi:peptide/nickel transport system permease protein
MALNLFLVSIFVFAMLRVVPGDAAVAILGETSRTDQQEKFREEYGLNKSPPRQYVDWTSGVLTGDFGRSLRSGKNVTTDFFDRLPITLEIVVLSFITTTVIGITFGILSALRQNSATDMGVRIFATMAIALPSFVLLTLLLIIPARLWSYAPPFGATDPFANPVENLRLFVPPTLLLALGSAAILLRYTRSGFLEVLRQDYIRTARSKGLSERDVTLRHALRNALPPVMTLAGLQLGGLLGGSVILERVMSLPGLGSWLLQAVEFKDYPVVMIVAMYTALTIMTINLVIDIAYGMIDPRIRVS